MTGYVCCIVADSQYAVHTGDVQSVVRAERLRASAGRDAIGTIRHGGADLQVYSLASLIGVREERDPTDRHVLIARGAGRDLGLLVDRVVRTSVGEDAAVLPLPAMVGDAARRRFLGLLRYQDWAYLVLSPASLDPEGTIADTRSRRPSTRSRAGAAADMVAVFASPALPECPAERYALPAWHVEELAQSLPSVPIPGAAPHVAALAWWRDEATPLLSFARHGEPPDTGNRLLIARCHVAGEETCVAFAVTGDVMLHRASRADRMVRFDAGRYPFVRGIFAVGGERVALLDLPSLMAPRVDAPRRYARAEVPALI